MTASPELRFLLAAAAPSHVAWQEPAALAACAVEDWPRFVHLVHLHRMAPRLARRLPDVPGVPPEIVAAVQRMHRSNAGLVMAQLRHFLRLVDVMVAEGIPFYVYKGPDLAVRLYGDPAARMYRDIDFMVPRRHVRPALAHLGDAGFRLLHPIPDGQVGAYMRMAHQFRCIGPDKAVLELHWRLLPPRWGHARRWARAWDRLESVDLAGRTLPSMRLDDYVPFLILHGHSHYWMRLHWLLDAVEARHKASAEGLYRRLPRDIRVAEATLDELLSRWYGIETPAVAKRASTTARRLADVVERELAKEADYTLAPGARMRYLAAGLPKMHRMRFYVSSVFMPSIDDLDFVRLPRWLYWAYPLVRLVRIATGRRAQERQE